MSRFTDLSTYIRIRMLPLLVCAPALVVTLCFCVADLVFSVFLLALCEVLKVWVNVCHRLKESRYVVF